MIRFGKVIATGPRFAVVLVDDVKCTIHPNDWRFVEAGEEKPHFADSREAVTMPRGLYDEMVVILRDDPIGRPRHWAKMDAWEKAELEIRSRQEAERLAEEAQRAREAEIIEAARLEAAAWRAAEEKAAAERSRHAEFRKLNPANIEEALASGWTEFSRTGNQAIMHFVDSNGKKRSRTFTIRPERGVTKKQRKMLRLVNVA